MKKLIMLFALVAAIGISASAQKINASKVPAAVKAACEKQFPGTKVKWGMEADKYEASFTQNGKEMSAVFDAAGKMLETEVEIKLSDLPAAVISYVKAHYAATKITEAAKITKSSGEVNYEAEVKGKDLLFDAKGNFLSEEKD